MIEPRDTQRSKVYSAERKVAGWGTVTMPDLDEVQRYVDKIVASTWWARRYPRLVHITVKDGRARSSAAADWLHRSLLMPRWSRFELVVLHEIAHLCNDYLNWYSRDRFGERCAPHGWQFAKAYLELVHHFLGAEKAAELKGHFKAGRVRYVKPREKRVLTGAEVRVLRERLAVARVAAAEKRATMPRVVEVQAEPGTTCPGCGDEFGTAYLALDGVVVCKPCVPYHRAPVAP